MQGARDLTYLPRPDAQSLRIGAFSFGLVYGTVKLAAHKVGVGGTPCLRSRRGPFGDACAGDDSLHTILVAASHPSFPLHRPRPPLPPRRPPTRRAASVPWVLPSRELAMRRERVDDGCPTGLCHS